MQIHAAGEARPLGAARGRGAEPDAPRAADRASPAKALSPPASAPAGKHGRRRPRRHRGEGGCEEARALYAANAQDVRDKGVSGGNRDLETEQLAQASGLGFRSPSHAHVRLCGESCFPARTPGAAETERVLERDSFPFCLRRPHTSVHVCLSP